MGFSDSVNSFWEKKTLCSTILVSGISDLL